jgi:uncharacterized protein (TIGR02145 family)
MAKKHQKLVSIGLIVGLFGIVFILIVLLINLDTQNNDRHLLSKKNRQIPTTKIIDLMQLKEIAIDKYIGLPDTEWSAILDETSFDVDTMISVSDISDYRKEYTVLVEDSSDMIYQFYSFVLNDTIFEVHLDSIPKETMYKATIQEIKHLVIHGQNYLVYNYNFASGTGGLMNIFVITDLQKWYTKQVLIEIGWDAIGITCSFDEDEVELDSEFQSVLKNYLLETGYLRPTTYNINDPVNAARKWFDDNQGLEERLQSDVDVPNLVFITKFDYWPDSTNFPSITDTCENRFYRINSLFKSFVYAYNKEEEKYFVIYVPPSKYDWIRSVNFINPHIVQMNDLYYDFKSNHLVKHINIDFDSDIGTLFPNDESLLQVYRGCDFNLEWPIEFAQALISTEGELNEVAINQIPKHAQKLYENLLRVYNTENDRFNADIRKDAEVSDTPKRLWWARFITILNSEVVNYQQAEEYCLEAEMHYSSEGMYKGPLVEADFASNYLLKNPSSSLKPGIQYFMLDHYLRAYGFAKWDGFENQAFNIAQKAWDVFQDIQASENVFLKVLACHVVRNENSNLHPFDLLFTSFFKDSRDSRSYPYKTIGTQTWMIENLAYLPSVSGSDKCSDDKPYYYVYDYEGTDVLKAKRKYNYIKYGVLYNWAAAQTACPYGWGLPKEEDWRILAKYLGKSLAGANDSDTRDSGAIGMKMKSTSGWYEDGHGDNSSGLNILPGGSRSNYPFGFRDLSKSAQFWTSSLDSSNHPFWCKLSYQTGNFMLFSGDRGRDGFWIRCLKN